MSKAKKIVLKALLAASFGFSSGACADKCLRHTDCDNGASCVLGACVITLKGDASVAPLTQTPPVTRPVDSATPPAAPASDAGATIDAGITTP
jgi:hypothetical protein